MHLHFHNQQETLWKILDLQQGRLQKVQISLAEALAPFIYLK
jgi:hypothetical protein